MKPNPAPKPAALSIPAGMPSESMMPLWRRIHGEFIFHSQKWELPSSVSFILIGLHLHPELSEPAVIARTNYMPRQTATFILDTLEKEKLAVRRAHPSDRRRKIVLLTPKGHTMAAAMFQDLLRFEAEALKDLNARDLTAAKRLLTQYADALALANEGETHP